MSEFTEPSFDVIRMDYLDRLHRVMELTRFRDDSDGKTIHALAAALNAALCTRRETDCSTYETGFWDGWEAAQECAIHALELRTNGGVLR